jgi:NadR type nicotinamide-nucleotide adenylyltransferase
MEKETEKRTIKVAITGPESTGKSWLAGHLADHYKTVWVKEFARDYLAGIERPYTYSDILTIARGQLHSENEISEKLNNGQVLFCDTEFIVTKIWCQVKYGYCHQFIHSLVKRRHYDLYLLCDIDLPWESDPLREHPHQRQYLFDLYRNELESNKFPYVIIRSMGNLRLENAVKAVDELLNSLK